MKLKFNLHLNYVIILAQIVLLKIVIQKKKKYEESLIITNLKNYSTLLNQNFAKNNFLVIDEFPIKLSKLLDKINIQLIKNKYKNQANIKIKKYNLNINKRVIILNQEELKLTEREIDIILFLNENSKPQTVHNLQNVVWGYSSELETHTVETHIYRLRKKVKDKFKDDNFINSSVSGYKIQMLKKNYIAKELRTKKYKPRIVKDKKGKGSFKRKKK